MATLKIDGREITVEPGTTILHAADQLGIEIPTFCYHPGLSIAANCRMCLVEASNSRKPVPACHAEAADGIEVFTETERIVKTRKAVLEFILLNHPVDCPICDKAGECVLQDHYFHYSAQPSRLFHRKQHKAKAKILGPDIILDAERCIMCTRCIRFCDEIAGESQLEMTYRGEFTELTTFPGEQLDNPYAGNTVDICPVGALTSRDFRFKTRVWKLESARSVCTGCSRGCSIRVDTHENTVRRLKPMHNPHVNDWWMCDEGRLSYHRYEEGRQLGPVYMKDGRRTVASLDTVLEVAGRIVAAPKRAVLVTPWLTNEDAFVLAKLLEAGGPLAGAKIYLGGRAPGVEDEILRKADKNPNRKGVETIFAAKGLTLQPVEDFSPQGIESLLVFGDEHDLDEGTVAKLGEVPNRVVMGGFKNALWDLATVFLPTRIPFEKDGSFTNFDGRVQRIHRAIKASPTCKSEGWYGLKLGQTLGFATDWTSPRAIFNAMAEEVPAFSGLNYDDLGQHGLALNTDAGQVADASTETA